MYKTGLPPYILAEKIVHKGVNFVLPKQTPASQRPRLDPDQFQPADPSPHVSTAPVNESLLYKRRLLRVGPDRELQQPSDADNCQSR